MAEEPKKAEVNGVKSLEIVVQLRHKPVMANGETVNELKFREPNAGDIERCGNPVLLDWSSEPPKATYDAKAMSAMMSTLAAVPPSTIRSMDARDWNMAAVQLAGFFVPV